MNNQSDLDWLARNVHEWHRSASHASVGANYPMWTYAPRIQSDAWFTKAQWLARRAELQNKPSWEGHPDAKVFVQNARGLWWKNTKTPDCRTYEHGWAIDADGGGDGFERISEGEVLGDWRDTLERRPEPFQPLTSIEDSQEQSMTKQTGMQQDNGWFERGELPPVGAECEFIRTGDVDWHKSLETGTKVKVLAHYSSCNDTVMVAVFAFNTLSGGDGVFMMTDQGMPMCFRPIRTEREKAIEQALKDSGALDCETVMSIIENLLDKGWVKETK